MSREKDTIALRFGQGQPSVDDLATIKTALDARPKVLLTPEHEKERIRLSKVLNTARIEASPTLSGHPTIADNRSLVLAVMKRALANSFRAVEQIMPYQMTHPVYATWNDLERRKNYWGAVAVLAGEKDGKPVQYVLEANNWYVPTGYGHAVDTVCSEKQILLQANQLIHKEGVKNPYFQVFGYINNAFDEFPNKDAVPNNMSPCGKCMNDFQSLMFRNNDAEFSKTHLTLKPDMPFIYVRRNESTDPDPISLRVIPMKDFGKNLGKLSDSRLNNMVLDNAPIAVVSPKYPIADQRNAMIANNLAGILPETVDTKKMAQRLIQILPQAFLKAKAMYDMEKVEYPKRDTVVAFLLYANKRAGQWTLEAEHRLMYSPKTRHFFYPELKAASNQVDNIVLVGYYGQSIALNPEAMEILSNKHRTVPNLMLATLRENVIHLTTLKDELPMLYVSAG